MAVGIVAKWVKTKQLRKLAYQEGFFYMNSLDWTYTLLYGASARGVVDPDQIPDEVRRFSELRQWVRKLASAPTIQKKKKPIV